MKKLLLTLLLALTVGAGAAWAASVEKSYMITFKTGSNTQTNFPTKTSIATDQYLTSGKEYVTTVASQSNSFPYTAEGIRVGSSTGAGNLIINLSDAGKVKATKVVINAKGNKSNSHLNWGSVANATTGQAISTSKFDDYTFTLDGTELTQLKLYGFARIFITSITVYYNEEITDPNQLAAPTISNDEELVTITNNAEGSTVYYSVNNETCDATSTPYTQPFVVEKGDVVRAISINGEKKSIVTETTITWIKTKYDNLGEFIADKPAQVVTFTCPLTAVYQNGQNLFVTDGTDYILVYGNVGQTYTNGDIIPAGAQGSFKDYLDTYEIEKVANFGAPTSGTPVAPQVITTSEITDALANRYVLIKDATLTTTAITDAAGSATAYDKFGLNLTGTEVDVYGFVCKYSAKLQINPIKIVGKPSQVTSDPVAVDETIEIVKGESVTFTSELAAKLKVEVDGQAAFESDGDTYVYTPDKASIITVTPLDADGNEYADLALMVSVEFKAAPLCGLPTFDPADGSAVFAGSKVSISCENAVKIVYVVGDGTETTANGSTAEVTVNEACTITAYGVNADGVESDIAEANYTIKEADRYKLITDTKDLKSGAKYILLGVSPSTNKVALMGGKSSDSKYRAAIFIDKKEDIITLAEPGNVAVFTIDEQSKDKYTIKVDGEDYLGVASVSTSSNVNLSYYTSVGTNTYFSISFDSNGAAKIQNGNYLQFNGNNNQERFKPYTGNQQTPYLYRLIDEEYVEAPTALYIHGHFWDRYYDFSQPVEMTADESGKVFTAEGIFIGGNEDASQNGFALSYVFSDSKAEAAAAQGRAIDGVDWSGLEGNVYHQNGNTHTVTGNTEEIEPWVVAKEGRYDITADFSGFSPVFSAKESTTTGVEGIGVDAAEAVYYNLQGVRVANPANGIYIRRQGAAVSKVYVK